MIEFHKIWIDQCAAAEGIQERFGTQDAIRYLVGEKLLRFMEVSQERPEFAEELPQFVTEIKRIFGPHELVTFFDDAEAGRVADPAKIFDGRAVEDD